jgi:hypothetical protein
MNDDITMDSKIGEGLMNAVNRLTFALYSVICTNLLLEVSLYRASFKSDFSGP